jgi:hypothetical protein
MFKDTKAFSGFSVNDLTAAKAFYSQTLGLKVEEIPAGLLLNIAGGNGTLIYPKDNHTPATYTTLNFPVENVEQAVDELTSKGVTFEHYENLTGQYLPPEGSRLVESCLASRDTTRVSVD